MSTRTDDELSWILMGEKSTSANGQRTWFYDLETADDVKISDHLFFWSSSFGKTIVISVVYWPHYSDVLSCLDTCNGKSNAVFPEIMS